MGKLLTYWWNYNMESKEPSLLFSVILILLAPFILVFLGYKEYCKYLERRSELRKEFWKKYKENSNAKNSI
jgi:hypothetical protein